MSSKWKYELSNDLLDFSNFALKLSLRKGSNVFIAKIYKHPLPVMPGWHICTHPK